MTVLILTSEEDVTADMVVAELHAAGTPFVRLDPADVPDRAVLSAHYANGAFEGRLSVNGRLLEMEDLRAVWVRRPGEPAAHAAHPSPWLTAETRQALFGMLFSAAPRWMNHPRNAERARLKPWQLRTAHRSGFAVPPTVFTTVPRVARQFAAEHGMNYPVVMDTPEIERLFTNIHALPTSFIIDRDGRIAQRHVGMLNASLTETETRVLAGLDANVRVEYREDQDKVKLENAAQANKIPGIDLSKLTPAQRTKVLQTLNSEECGCGCGQTLAQCRLEDPTCTVSLPAAEEIVKRIVAETAR